MFDLSAAPVIEDKNDEIGLARLRMFYERNCPPRFVLEAGGPQVEKHLEKCEHCRDILENKPKVLQFEHLEKSEQISFGQVRRLVTLHNPGMLWDEHNNYVNPPLIFPLSPSKDGGSIVAIVFDEPLLALSDDVPIGNNYFVEMWNTIKIPNCFIGEEIYYTADIDPHVFMEAKPQQPEKYSHIYRFRQQEMMLAWSLQYIGKQTVN